MTHEFDPGYTKDPFRTLCREYPAQEIYPVQDFRVEWGPIFHRGRLDGTARVVIIGQDPAAHENIVRRILVGEAGQRTQGLLARLGMDRSYVMVNTFLYSAYGQGGGDRHKDDPAIAEYRNRWLDAVINENTVQAVISLGQLADHAFQMWSQTPNGKSIELTYRTIIHPTYPESASASGSTTKAAATKKLLENWNAALPALHAAIKHPDTPRTLKLYGDTFADGDLVTIPEEDLPAGTPEWMRSLAAWATRSGANASEKRATIEVRVPKAAQTW